MEDRVLSLRDDDVIDMIADTYLDYKKATNTTLTFREYCLLYASNEKTTCGWQYLI